MKKEILDFLQKENIDMYGITDTSRCNIKLGHVLKRAGFAVDEGDDGKTPRSMLCLCFPYFCGIGGKVFRISAKVRKAQA